MVILSKAKDLLSAFDPGNDVKYPLSKWYTRIIGVFFLLVAVSLAADLFRFGFRAETMHKVFHVLLGAIVVRYGWNSAAWWRTFPLANGGFFCFVGLFGWLFPDFGGLDAFNPVDTLLHSTVGTSGVLVGLVARPTVDHPARQ